MSGSVNAIPSARNIALVFFEYANIFTAAWVGMQSQSLWVQALVTFWIGTRMHALGAFMHEASHFLLCKPRWLNEVIGRLLLSWPAFFSIEAYRESHFQHHRHPLTEKDPAYVKKLKSYFFQYPKRSKIELIGISLFILFGGGVLLNLLSLLRLSRGGIRKNSIYDQVGRFAFMIAIIGALQHFSAWGLYFRFWLIPSITVFSLLNYWRTVAEHLSIPGSGIAARSLKLSAIGRFIFLPYHIDRHAEHHAAPAMSWQYLDRVQSSESLHRVNLSEFFNECVES